MPEIRKFEPNWKLYCIILIASLIFVLGLHALFDFGVTAWLVLSGLMIVVSVVLLKTQSRLELNHDNIRIGPLLPGIPSKTIQLEQIDWIALDKRPISLAGFRLLQRSSVIMKLKDDQLITLPLLLLKNKTVLEHYFLDLSHTLADHDKELFKLKDLHGFSQLAIDATLGLTDLVESMHHNFTRLPGMPLTEKGSKTSGVTSMVYKNIKAITALTGGGIDGLLAQLSPLLSKDASTEINSATNTAHQISYERAALLSALNGVLGDYLEVRHNPMSIPMRFRRNGHSLKLNATDLSLAIQPLNGKLIVLVHGLCMNDLQWRRKGHDHGEALSQEFGYSTVYLRYNTGRHISTNGRSFSALLEVLVKIWPVQLEELIIIGHSMGGLVSRSAAHYAQEAGHQWLKKLCKMVFLGSPHHGAPLERGGNWIDTLLDATPYTAPLARLGKIRSAGITDLRYGNVIDAHWQGRDRFERSPDNRLPVQLPKKVPCYTIAGTTGNEVGDVRDQLLGDGLVQVNSALGIHKKPSLCLDIPAERQWIAYGVNHMDLLNNPSVYEKIREWLS